MKAVGMSFPGVRALDGVSLDLHRGELHALVGENGAGKSTLMKVLGGVYPAGEYEGGIFVDGVEQRFRGIRDADSAGIAIVFQELSLVRQLTVAENIFLGRLPSRGGFLRRHDLHARAARILRDLDFDLSPETPVSELGIGQQQLVEIAKALSHDARILVLDEPTAALNDSEAATLYQVIAALQRRGIGLIYISHRLDEVLELGDRITVLRDGRTIETRARGSITRSQLVSLMVGREIADIYPARQSRIGGLLLEVEHLTVKHPALQGRNVLEDISFAVRGGEVLGIAGLMGSGRTALMNVLFGTFPERAKGIIKIEGRAVSISDPKAAKRNGLAFVSEDRKKLGLSLGASIAENITMAATHRFARGPVLRRFARLAAAEDMMARMRVRAASVESVVGTLSGGNQQKVVLGNWLLTGPRLMLLDEPTRGVDVGAKQEIYSRINGLAEEGMGVVMVSSEMEELRGMCDRILVLHEGRLTAVLDRAQASAETIMTYATGARHTPIEGGRVQ